jgi:hypothetical protein
VQYYNSNENNVIPLKFVKSYIKEHTRDYKGDRPAASPSTTTISERN